VARRRDGLPDGRTLRAGWQAAEVVAWLIEAALHLPGILFSL